jgi:hypothetical protein
MYKEIDSEILRNQAAELASLVFPANEKLSKLTENAKNPLEKSLIIYKEIEKAVFIHLKFLEKIR